MPDVEFGFVQPELMSEVLKSVGHGGHYAGEGSRGGKVIGHTKSGKPIYSHDSHHYSGVKAAHGSGWGHIATGEHLQEKFPDYTAQDHEDAAHAIADSGPYSHEKDLVRAGHGFAADHIKMGGVENGKSIGEKAFIASKKSKMGDYQDDPRGENAIRKALATQALCAGIVAKSMAEGSRGGKVIGHTKSGKPVYEGGHAHYTTGHKLPKWNVNPSLQSVGGVDDSTRRKLVNRTEGFRGWSAQDHADAAELHEKHQQDKEVEHSQALQSAHDNANNAGKPAGMHIGGGLRHGFKSTGVHDDYSPEDNDKIRESAITAQRAKFAALAHRAATKFNKN